MMIKVGQYYKVINSKAPTIFIIEKIQYGGDGARCTVRMITTSGATHTGILFADSIFDAAELLSEEEVTWYLLSENR